MKKWKVLLVMLCAMLVSIGLFACKGGDEEEGASIQRISGATGDKNLSYTDNDTWEGILGKLQDKITLKCKPVEGDLFDVKGTDCDFTHTIKLDENGHCEVGRYTITIKPKENNPKNQSRTVDVTITHKFAATQTANLDMCEYCQATRTSATQNAIIHYGKFHSGTAATVPESVYGEDETNGAVFTDKSETQFIKKFGKVKVDDGRGDVNDVEIPTLTVGQLEPGMTITVKGKAQTSFKKWDANMENAFYYFPVIGIADRNLNDPEWEGTPTDNGDYVGGTSVFVRGEGWVLYNGIGDLAESRRPLAALSSYAGSGFGDGTGEGRNYGSHENATLGEKEVRPTSFVPGQVPSVENWKDWIVYSMGTTQNSGTAYTTETTIELTWNYRQDGVIELTYNVNGSELVCMIKVPDSSTGYYDTILHGDYVDMWIESYERIEKLTPEEFSISVNHDKTYYEGETFDPATVSAQFTYKQLEGARPQSITLENVYATEKTKAELDADSDEKLTEAEINAEGVTWVSMAENPVLKKYNTYKVQLSKGGKTWIQVFDASELTIVSNVIEYATGADVGNYDNNNTVGEFAFRTEGGKIILTPKGKVFVQAIPSGATFSETTTDAHRYVAIKMDVFNGKTLNASTTDGFAVKSGETSVPYIYDATDKTLVLALTESTKTVTIEKLQETPTVFDFSAARGFTISSSIEIDTANGAWTLNNESNTVTVTFTNKAESWGYIHLGGMDFWDPQELPDLLKGPDDTVKEQVTLDDGVTLLKKGTAYDKSTETLTIVVAFPKANVLNYEARKIEITTNNTTEFEYKIDYKPEFIDDGKTYDAGYYSFVSDGNIYLAKVAQSGENALGINVNAGNDKIALLDLSYNYNATTGAATFKNRTLTGAEISVLKIGGEHIVLLKVDPKANGITGDKYGYQLKTLDNDEMTFSAKYFAVAEGEAKLETASTSSESIVILNEGSCLEKGLAGNMSGKEGAKFIANPTEFAGNHKMSGAASGATCEYCGETLDRNKSWKSYTLHENEFVEIWESFTEGSVTLKNDKGDAAMWSGLYVKLEIGSKTYRLRNDGAIMDFAPNTEVTDSSITSSLDENNGARTPLGRYDADGDIINETKYLDTLNQGASFRVWLGYEDNTLTVVWRIYKKNDSRVYYEFTHKFANVKENELKVTFALDGATVAQGNSKGNANFINGTIDKTMISDATAETGSNVELTIGNIKDHFATVTATSGNATEIPTGNEGKDIREELGITDKPEYTKYVMVSIALGKACTNGSGAVALVDVYTDAALKNLRQGAKAVFDAEKKVITVTVAFSADNAPDTLYLDLKNNTGHTLQNDIKLDLSAVSTYATNGEVDTSSTATAITGGVLKFNYTSIDEIKDLKIGINGGAAIAPSDSMTFDGGTAKWEAGTDNTATLTLTINPAYDIKAVPEYTVKLYDGEKVAVTNRYTLGIPKTENNVLVKADKSALYIYLLDTASTGKDYLEFSANNAKTITDQKARILPYNLAHSVNGNIVTFTTANEFTKKIAATHVEDGAFKLTQLKVDLSYFAIEESAPYYFYLNDSKEAEAGYNTVNENRQIGEITHDSSATLVEAAPIGCTSLGSKGYEIKNGENQVVGYYGLEVVPSHNWQQHSTESTRFECSVCHAVLGSGDVTKGSMPAMPAIGEGANAKSIVNEGLTISYVNSNSADGEWTQSIATNGGINFALLCLDPYWNTVDKLTDATQEMKDLGKKLYKANCWPGIGGGTDTLGSGCFVGTTSYMTLTISVTDGIRAYKDGVFAFNYAAKTVLNVADAEDKTGTVADFAKLFLLLVEKYGFSFGSGVQAKDAIVQRGTLTAEQVQERYNLYEEEKDYLPKPHDHEYGSDHRCTICNELDPRYDFPTYTTDTSFTLGTDGTQESVNWTGYTPTTGKYFKVEQGKKLTIAGTMKSQANNNWSTPLISVFSGKAMLTGIFRGDNYIIDDNGEKLQQNEGWKIDRAHTHSANDDTWTEFRGIIADCSLTLEIDWTDTGKIVITETYTKTSDTAKVATQTYTITPATGKTFLEQYSAELGFESCYINVTSVTIA